MCKLFIFLIGSLNSKRSWLYDVLTDSFERTGNLNIKRIEHTCAPIPNTETVGCIGGYSAESYTQFGDPDLRKMEIFDMNTKGV